ncbi:MAG: stage II sporulation protein M [Parachlamydia sp.]|nr:stage II sporulation protein M [Parachlamydia sp.]
MKFHTITTIDNVELQFELAGLGSRLIAGVIDTLILTLLLIVPAVTMTLDSNFVKAAAIFAIFACLWGYHLVFEVICQGQTPGKRLMGIQVLNLQGHLVSWRESTIRNLIRLLDSLPTPFYLLGGVFIGFDGKNQRLGDMAAGTIIVKKWKATGGHAFGASWISRLEKGEMPVALRLQHGSLDAKRLGIIVSFIQRRESLQQPSRGALAWKIAEPLLDICGESREDYASDAERPQRSEALLEKIFASLQSSKTKQSEQKLNLWRSFAKQMIAVSIKKLPSVELAQLLDSYRKIISDLARARSKATDNETLQELNQLAIRGHQLFNRPCQRWQTLKVPLFSSFPRLVRRYFRFMLFSAFLFFAPALVTYLAIQWNPDLAYDLVSEFFLDFNPYQEDNMHGIPPLTRPVAASGIITNNIQVTFCAFAFGVTAGIGTAYLLIFNGIHLGAILSWLMLQGHGKACLGWILPHAGTEILAIILAGGAGFILADAILRPGLLSFKESLKRAAAKAVTIEIGCMVMLLAAGLIEGFISPSSIDFSARVLWLAASCVFWSVYFCWIGRKSSKFC